MEKSKGKSGNLKENTLVDKGILRRSIQTETTLEEGKVFTEVDYAKIHNEGGEIKATAKISLFKRKRKGKTEKM